MSYLQTSLQKHENRKGTGDESKGSKVLVAAVAASASAAAVVVVVTK